MEELLRLLIEFVRETPEWEADLDQTGCPTDTYSCYYCGGGGMSEKTDSGKPRKRYVRFHKEGCLNKRVRDFIDEQERQDRKGQKDEGAG